MSTAATDYFWIDFDYTSHPTDPAPAYITADGASERKFSALRDQWQNDALDFSSSDLIASHPAYLQIIAMGEQTLPFIFDELSAGPGHWFDALEAITGLHDVVPPEDRGNLDRMTDAWLDWARTEGYI